MIKFITKNKTITKDRKGFAIYKVIMGLFQKHRILTTREINQQVDVESVAAEIQYINDHKNMTIVKRSRDRLNSHGQIRKFKYWERIDKEAA